MCFLVFHLCSQRFNPIVTVFVRNESTNLKEVLAKKIPIEQDNVKNFRKEFGATKIGDVTVESVCKQIFYSQFSGTIK